MEYVFSYVWDKGNYLSVNQDSLSVQYVYTEQGPIFMGIVADGVGSLSHSEYVSKLICTYLNSWFVKTGIPLILKGKSSKTIVRSILRTVDYINDKICQSSNYFKSGSTLAMVILYKRKYIVANIGDSSVYLYHKELRKLSVEDINNKRELTQALGVDSSVKIHWKAGRIKHKSSFIVCSDGFDNLLSIDDLVNLSTCCRGKRREQIKTYLKEVKEGIQRRGERDNISAILIHVK